jgi:signal-transduction protein with cAMP-binding, CBS, and nucleotidyltransferase domain
MKDKNVSSLVVVDGKGKPQGLVTERDLIRKVCINDLHTSMVKNKEIMTCPLITESYSFIMKVKQFHKNIDFLTTR